MTAPLHAPLTSLPETSSLATTLAGVIDRLSEGVLLVDRAWRITYANPFARSIGHLTAENLNRETLWELYPEIVGTYLEEGYRAVMQFGVERTLEPFFWEPHALWLIIRVLPAADGIALYYSDVTQARQSQDSLRASEERYRVLTELSPQSQWTASPQGLVLYANQRFLEYIGHHFVPRTGEEYIDCFDPVDRQRVIEAWTHSVSTGEDYAIDARLLRASDGASRWWHLRALPVRDHTGAIELWLGSASDVHEQYLQTERLAATNRAIERQRAELEAIYSASPIGLSLYDPKDFRILRINQRNAEVLGLTPDAAVGKTAQEAAPEMIAAYPLLERAAQGESIHGHIVEGHLPGTPEVLRTFNVNYTPLLREDGSVRAIASASLEITEQKRAEIALIQSEKLAAVGRMASSIAHEINNPLESVTNLLYIANQSPSLVEIRHFLDLADQELRRVSVIVNQTLRFHKQATSPREITCSDLYTTVLSMYEGKLRNSSVAVEKRKRAERAISCFEGDIRQVLNNLVGNAIDAMPQGGRLLLRSRASTDWRTGRKGITLTVADTGIGISATSMPHLFEAFYSTKGNQGTGLGLWISAEILMRHEGRICVRSSQRATSHGSVFCLFLPFDAVHITTPSRPN